MTEQCDICGRDNVTHIVNERPFCEECYQFYYYPTNQEELKQRIAELESQLPRWIPVSERLPSEEDCVLMSFPDGSVEYGYTCLDTEDDIPYTRVRVWKYFTYSEEEYCEENPVCWMPRPEPPKEVEG